MVSWRVGHDWATELNWTDRYCCVVVIKSLSSVWLFAASWTAAHQTSRSFTISWSLLKLISIELVILSNNLVLCYPLILLPPIFPNIWVFSSESVLHIRWPKDWSFSFRFSPSNEYSGFISFRIGFLQSTGLLRVFSNTTVWKHQFFDSQPSLWANTHTHMWLLEIHSFGYR